MIDLKRPLDGVPGLLLLAALVLFGATIGIAVAIGFTWIPMSGELANFLGGVVGAGLGAALAVLGAVYVQRRDARERLTAPLNEMQHRLRNLIFALDLLRLVLLGGGAPLAKVAEALQAVNEALGLVPAGSELPPPVHAFIAASKDTLPLLLDSTRKLVTGQGDPATVRADVMGETAFAKDLAGEMLRRVEGL